MGGGITAKSIINSIINTLKKENKAMPIWTKIIIVWFTLVVMGFITATAVLFPVLLIQGIVKPGDMILLVGTFFGVGALGGMCKLASLGYDQDKNGIPDSFEKRDKDV